MATLSYEIIFKQFSEKLKLGVKTPYIIHLKEHLVSNVEGYHATHLF